MRRERNMKKRILNWKTALAALLILALAYLALGPIPVKVHREYKGLARAYGLDGEVQNCTVTLEGMYYVYLFRYNELFSTFDISLDGRTAEGCGVQTTVSRDSVSQLTYWGEDTGYFSVGWFVSPDMLDWLYIMLEGEDSVTEIAASPDGTLSVDDARTRAGQRVSGLMPELQAKPRTAPSGE